MTCNTLRVRDAFGIAHAQSASANRPGRQSHTLTTQTMRCEFGAVTAPHSQRASANRPTGEAGPAYEC
jgi:hypothetical protein